MELPPELLPALLLPAGTLTGVLADADGGPDGVVADAAAAAATGSAVEGVDGNVISDPLSICELELDGPSEVLDDDADDAVAGGSGAFDDDDDDDGSPADA